MAKEKTSDKEIVKQEGAKKKISLDVELTGDADFVVCKVCGHKNSNDAGMCAMCSNYLFID